MENYKAQIKRLLGYTNDRRSKDFDAGEKAYKQLYKQFSARVRNYSRATGVQLSASRELLYNVKFAGNLTEREQAIAATPATRARTAGQYLPISQKATAQIFSAAEKRAVENFAGLARVSPVLASAEQTLLKGGQMTNAEQDRVRYTIGEKWKNRAETEIKARQASKGRLLTREERAAIKSKYDRQKGAELKSFNKRMADTKGKMTTGDFAAIGTAISIKHKYQSAEDPAAWYSET